MYYKVLSKDAEGLCSALLPSYNSAAVRYVPGVTTYPKIPGTKLFVFGRLEDALEFSLVHDLPEEVWKCQAWGVERAHYRLVLEDWPQDSLEKWWGLESIITRGWDHPDAFTYDLPMLEAPGGTIVCDSLRLLVKMSCV